MRTFGFSSKKTLIALAIASSAQVMASDDALEEVNVVGVRDRLGEAGLLKNVIEKTEVLGGDFIVSSRAVNLTEVMQDSPGVVIANECSMCGYKRIQLNGLKAEHTNIFIDGLPVHTIVSGFYAVDAIAMTGVDRIEVARGAGASMIAPEAIGGVVNVMTTERKENSGMIDVSGGENGYRQVGMLGTLVSADETLRTTIIGQYDDRDQADEDDNGVNENPMMENQSLTARFSWDFSERDNLVVRLSRAEQEVFGGPVLGDTASSIRSAMNSIALGESAQLFVGDDVRNRFIGNAWETTEWVSTERNEYSASWLREINDRWNMTLTASGSDHHQDSFYEGFDYIADDEMLYLDARFNFALNDRHFLTFGIDNRDENMRSQSDVGDSANSDDDPTTVYVSDSFDYLVTGLYIQDSMTFSENFEVKAAVRVDQIEADFIDPSKPGTEISETLISPRLDARYIHSDQWTSRFSMGRGYRAPLSFFETDHGILDATIGFEVDVDELERSLSAGYTLSYEGERLVATLALNHTNIDNLSTLDETEAGVPLLTQMDDDASVSAVDLAMTYRVTESLALGLTAQQYFHSDEFQSSFGVATTEQQLNLTADWDVGEWEVYGALTWVGNRDLTDYGYEGFNDAAATQAKPTDADAFFWVDVKVTRAIGENWSLYAGANNLLDYTQVNDDDTPLMFDADGGYDVAYIYGPLRGREVYAGVSYQF